MITFVSGLVLAVVVGLMIVVSEVARPPRLVYPASVQATIEAGLEDWNLRQSDNRPISNQMLKELLKAYGLEDCLVGGKYGALCEDGTFTRTGLLREDLLDAVCSQHGGVREWIECR
jgi:hypothetical protein